MFCHSFLKPFSTRKTNLHNKRLRKRKEPIRCHFVRLRLEGLEDRLLLNSDVLVWNPGIGNNGIVQDYNASNGTNWWDYSFGKPWSQMQGGPPTIENFIWLVNDNLDHGANAPITWDKNLEPNQPGQTPTHLGVALILLKGGYNQQQTINPGVSLQSAQGMSDDTKSTINIYFSANNSSFWQTGGSATWTNFKLINGAGNAVFTGFGIDGGSLYLSNNSGQTEISQVGMEVYPTADIVFGDSQLGTLSTLYLQNGTGYVAAYGGSILLYGSGGGSDFVQGDGSNNYAVGSEELWASGFNGAVGSIFYAGKSIPQSLGRSLITQDTVSVPLIVNSGGALYLHGGGAFSSVNDGTGNYGSELKVYGQTNDSYGYSVYVSNNVAGQSSEMTMDGNLTLYTASDIDVVGPGATLATTDDTDVYLQVNNTAVLGIGSNLQIYGSIGNPNTYPYLMGTLTIWGNLYMNGTYSPVIGYSGVEPFGAAWATVLNVSGNETWGSNSWIYVTALGPNIGSNSFVAWTVITCDGTVTGQLGGISGNLHGSNTSWHWDYDGSNLIVWYW